MEKARRRDRRKKRLIAMGLRLRGAAERALGKAVSAR
jgi:hypothetical protein